MSIVANVLVAGLVWRLVGDQTDVKVFLLVRVVVAGLSGAATVSTGSWSSRRYRPR
jgi:uncharacterized membrane protein